jgi:pimeloyl-ACP methyl ester carboxylesterase
MNSHTIKASRYWALPTALGIGIASVALVGIIPSADASRPSQHTRPTVVLVHGAWADGSSWAQVSDRLQKEGYSVRVPPNNLRGVASDAADLASYLSTISGPIVLVGHSYGGMVITNAATGNSNVHALVYVDAYIPSDGDTILGLTHPPSVFAADPTTVFDFVPYSGAPAGAVDVYVKTSVYGDALANEGFSRQETRVMAASQRPLSTQALNEASGPAAWQAIPSWAIVGADDHAIPAADQIAMAERAGSQIVEVNAPHLSMLTNARTVADVITQAANATDHPTGVRSGTN